MPRNSKDYGGTPTAPLWDAQTTHANERPSDTRSNEPQPDNSAAFWSPPARATRVVDWLKMTSVEFESRHPLTCRPHANLLNRRVARALPALRKRPSEQDLQGKPMELALHLPLPPALRFYAFTATQHEAERQTDT